MANKTGKGGFKTGVSGNPKGRPPNNKPNNKLLESNAPDVIVFSLNEVQQAPTVNPLAYKRMPYIYFGTNNLFPQDLIKYYDNISYHRTAIDTNVQFIAGNGFSFEGDKGAENFINEATKGKPNTFLNKLALDVYINNGAYINVLYERSGKISQIYNRDASTIRSGKQNEKGIIDKYYHSSDWSIATGRRELTGDRAIYQPKEIPAYNPKTYSETKNGQLIYVENTLGTLGRLFYTEPKYLAIINLLDISSKIADLHKNNLDNGMVASTHIHVFEDLTDRQKRIRVEKGIKTKFAGSNNAGKIILTWSKDTDKEPIINTLQTSDAYEIAMKLDDKADRKIVSAHRIPPILMGFDVPTGLGGKGLGIRESFNLFQKTTIQPYQTLITEYIDVILKHNGIKADTKIIDISPSDFTVSDEMLLKINTVNELREDLLNKEPIEGGDKIPEAKQPTNVT